jgi:hypothetical protein
VPLLAGFGRATGFGRAETRAGLFATGFAAGRLAAFLAVLAICLFPRPIIRIRKNPTTDYSVETRETEMSAKPLLNVVKN